MPTITDDELARVQYLLHQAVEAARGLEAVPEAREQSDVIEIALTEARKVLRVVEARGVQKEDRQHE